jgi:hypothetical protein
LLPAPIPTGAAGADHRPGRALILYAPGTVFRVRRRDSPAPSLPLLPRMRIRRRSPILEAAGRAQTGPLVTGAASRHRRRVGTCGTTHHPKPVVVVAVVGLLRKLVVPVAVRRAGVVGNLRLLVVPEQSKIAAAPHHPVVAGEPHRPGSVPHDIPRLHPDHTAKTIFGDSRLRRDPALRAGGSLRSPISDQSSSGSVISVPVFGDSTRWGTTHHPKPEAVVAIVRIVEVADRRAGVGLE